MRYYRHYFIWLEALLLGAMMAGGMLAMINYLQPKTTITTDNTNGTLYSVVSIIDGDTIKIIYEGQETSVRIIGVNTPETVDPRTTVECFGEEASNYLKNLLTGKKVRIEADPTQSDRDKYDRLLRYVYLDGQDVGLNIISNGYGYEYTYYIPYNKQEIYKKAQAEAESANRGLWAEGICQESNTQEESSEPEPEPAPEPEPESEEQTMVPTQECLIKGNINYKGERIYHVPGQQYYNETKISPEYGERWFCSEEEAQAAGWRKSKV